MTTLTAARKSSPIQAWVRALERTADIPNNPHRILPNVIDELAETFGDAPALVSDAERLTYRGLSRRSNQYARWALDQGLRKGDAVCLLMPNRPEYMAIWLGLTRAGCIVSLLNTNLSGRSLAHSMEIVQPKHVISDALDIERYGGDPLTTSERRTVTLDDTALYIYTSGTTGMPKAANVSHFRVMQWAFWFGGLMDTNSADRMYNCLPMYHSVGGIVAIGSVLTAGGSVIIREKFSAREFWKDIVRWDCTLFQYIGELCRYLLHTEPVQYEIEHQIRMCCGNGLRPDVWNDFKTRFRIPQILEFYAATEGNVSLFNAEDKAGAIGRIPPFLAHRFPAALVKADMEKQEPLRNEQGLCIRCAPNEIGEAIGKIGGDGVGGRFEGYTSKEDSEKKILRDVFEPGDAWFRTGDLMRKDEKGYFYFVDRVGDTFRWKGENVSCSEVSEAICEFDGVKDAAVYGVTTPGTDGRAGMAAVVIEDTLDLAGFREHLIHRLPHFARPLFFRFRKELPITGTFKHTKTDLIRDAYDPSVTSDQVYFNDPEAGALVPVDKALFRQIQSGKFRL